MFDVFFLVFLHFRNVKDVKKERFAWPDFSFRSHILAISRGRGGCVQLRCSLITSVFLILLVCYPLHQRAACEVNMLFSQLNWSLNRFFCNNKPQQDALLLWCNYWNTQDPTFLRDSLRCDFIILRRVTCAPGYIFENINIGVNSSHKRDKICIVFEE